jgi:hypothetical protein
MKLQRYLETGSPFWGKIDIIIVSLELIASFGCFWGAMRLLQNQTFFLATLGMALFVISVGNMVMLALPRFVMWIFQDE